MRKREERGGKGPREKVEGGGRVREASYPIVRRYEDLFSYVSSSHPRLWKYTFISVKAFYEYTITVIGLTFETFRWGPDDD